ncbi:MAG TPA: hypothetical protein VKU88_10625 [Acidimicrobiales bacterium]|nr:hypothetical protein [Acidimicrobiales bacterium]
MVLLALTTDQVAWWATLGAGLVIALVVWGLLEVLRRTVRDVDEAVGQVWTMGKRLAQNTQAAHLLGTTKVRGGQLLQELSAHRAAQSRPTRERS